MRTNESGQEVPETLGEYRSLCVALGGDRCPAVIFLDHKIATARNGANEVILADDDQMRALLRSINRFKERELSHDIRRSV